MVMDQAEIPAMTELHDTYGKTVHTCKSGSRSAGKGKRGHR
jgi:hypothetical protein